MSESVRPESPISPPNCGRDWLAIAAIAFIGLVPRAWSLAHTEVAARDSIGFIRSALEIEKPPVDYRDPSRHFTRVEVFQYTLQPPGYPLWILAVSQPVRAIAGTSCETMVLSAQLAAVLASLLLIVPMYFLGKRLFGPTVASVSALLFQILPVVVQLTSDGLSESFFLLQAVTAVWVATLALETRRFLYFGLTGAAIGLAYLVRPEGLIVGVGFALALASLLKGRRIALFGAAGRGALVAAGFVIVAGPYIATIGGLTNKTSGKGLLKYLKGQEVEPTWQNRVEDAALFSNGRASPALFADFSSNVNGSAAARAAFALKAMASEFFKAGFYLPPLFGLFGFYRLGRSGGDSSGLQLLLLVVASNLALLFVLGYRIGYISDRHTMLATCLGCYAAAYAMVELARRFSAPNAEITRRWAITGALFFGGCYACDFRTLHSGRAGHHAAGSWLAANLKADEVLWDPFNWAEFYAGRSLYGEPDRNPERGPVYAVIEPQHNTPHGRLPMLPTAREIARQGEPVYHWPENAPLDRAKVVIYRTASFKKSKDD